MTTFRGSNSQVKAWLSHCGSWPTSRSVSNTLEALQAIGHLGQDITPPAWLKDGEVPASEMVAMTNGLLHLPTRTLQPHTPDFFSLHSLAFDFDPSAPEPER